MNTLTAADIVAALGLQGVASSSIQPLPSAHEKCGDGVVAVGPGQPALELAAFPARQALTATEARELWAARQAGRPNPLVLLLLSGLDDDAQTVWVGADPASLGVVELEWVQAAGLAAGALKEPNGPAAIRYLEHSVPRPGEDAIPGLNNLGMFASHTLTELVPAYPEWAASEQDGARVASLRGRELLEALGFNIETQAGSPVELLRDRDERAAAVAVFLDQGETADTPLPRMGGETPVSAALARAERENLRFVFIARGDALRLHVTGSIHGVGRKGPAETLVEVDMPLLRREQLAYVPLIFSAKAIADGGTFERILAESRDYSVKLSERLRERIYVDVVPDLAVAVARANTEDTLDEVYEQTLVLLFRLLFIAYAEDRDLLPYRRNDRYRHASLKALARELADLVEEERDHSGDETTSLWARVNALFEAVDKGAPTWDVPAYNGGLFAVDEAVNEAGAALADIELTNEQLGSALTALLVEPGAGDLPTAPVDFRSLSVRDFGTIYEGLLESGISEAPEDLALDRNGNYIPAGDREPVVRSGDIYHHNRGGARKSTGSYFTKDFAVEHLLEHALVPAVDAHLERVGSLYERDVDAAAAAFFDFRCADIAMGSGHFLVAAVDRIEERFSRFLDERPVEGVLRELDTLRAAARKGLGESASLYEIERRALLRRQIARRCVYGVDVNRIAVELAQLALWVHTFVPGLALTYLGHNLVCGNALTGMGTLEEAADALDDEADGRISLFLDPIRAFLDETTRPLERLAKANDATRENMQVVYDAQRDADRAAQPAADLFDLICAQRRGETANVQMALSPELVEAHPGLEPARLQGVELQALHFPVAFPEVFLSERGGFDCIVGNPPWDKVRFEAQQFWVTRDPGLNALSVAERTARIETLRATNAEAAAEERREHQERELLQKHFETAFAWQGAGHHEFAKGFLERSLRLTPTGNLGLVLPRQALVLRGWSRLRQVLVHEGATSLTQARNAGGWLFDDVEHRYMIALLARIQTPVASLVVTPAVDSLEAFEALEPSAQVVFRGPELADFGESAAIPWFSSKAAADVLRHVVPRPSLSSGQGWIRGRSETRYDFSGSGRLRDLAIQPPTSDAWSVMQTRHVTQYAIDWTQPPLASVTDLEALSARVAGFVRDGRQRWLLGGEHPTIVYRYPSRNDDSRTLIAAALPASGALPTTGYAHTIRCPDTPAGDVLALLGLLNSLACDWWARRFVDRHVTAPVINGLRLPEWSPKDREAVASQVASIVLAQYDELAGNISLREFADAVADSDERMGALVSIDLAAFRGFGLSGAEVEVILDDFSVRAVPEDYRARLREGITV